MLLFSTSPLLTHTYYIASPPGSLSSPHDHHPQGRPSLTPRLGSYICSLVAATCRCSCINNKSHIPRPSMLATQKRNSSERSVAQEGQERTRGISSKSHADKKSRFGDQIARRRARAVQSQRNGIPQMGHAFVEVHKQTKLIRPLSCQLLSLVRVCRMEVPNCR